MTSKDIKTVSKRSGSGIRKIPQKYSNNILIGMILTFPLLFFAELMYESILYQISGLLAIIGVFMMLFNLYLGLRKKEPLQP